MARLLHVLISYPEHPVFAKTQSFFDRLFGGTSHNVRRKVGKQSDSKRSVWIPGAENEMDTWVRDINQN